MISLFSVSGLVDIPGVRHTNKRGRRVYFVFYQHSCLLYTACCFIFVDGACFLFFGHSFMSEYKTYQVK